MTRKYGILGIILRYEWLILLAVAPLLVFPNTVRSLALIVVPLLWIVRKIRTGRFFDRTPLDWPLALLMLMVLVSLFATYDISQSLPKICGIVLGLAVYYCVVHRCTHRSAWAAAAGIFLLAGIGICLLAVLGSQWPDKVPFLSSLPTWLPLRITGLPGAEEGINANEVAGALLWVVPLTWTLLIAALIYAGNLWKSIGHWRTVAVVTASLLISGLTTGILTLTQSRAGLLGLVLASPIVIPVFSPGRTRRTAFIAFLLFLGASLTVVAALGPGIMGSAFETDATSEGSIVSLHSMEGRLEIWSRSIYGIQDFAFTGMGMNTFREVVHILYPLFHIGPDTNIGHAHNEFLQAALDLGIPGLIAFLSVNLGAFWMLAQTWKRRGRLPFPESLSRSLILGLGGGLAAHMIYGLLDAVALGAKPGIIWWMLLGLIASLYQRPALRAKQQESAGARGPAPRCALSASRGAGE